MSKVSFKTLSKIAGPLIFVEGVRDAAYGDHTGKAGTRVQPDGDHHGAQREL